MTIYNQDSIKTISFGKAIRTKLGMYLSADLDQALVLGLRELIYNATDEYEQGYGNRIAIIIDTKQGVITIKDNARGVPVGTREDGTNSLVAAFTTSHSGAKHDTEVYSSAVGINGIGAKVVCHTSEWMKVSVGREGQTYHVEFKESEEGAIPSTITVFDTQGFQGTSIQYKPSKLIYGDRKIDVEQIKATLQELSYFTKGMTFSLTIGTEEIVYHSKNGLSDALDKNERVHKTALYFYKEIANVKVELALQWCKAKAELRPFANNLFVPEGGAFITGFKTSLTKAFNTTTGKDFSGDIIRKYLDGYVSVKVKIPQFSNQAKTSLANTEARTATSAAITEAFKQFANDNPADIEKILDLMEREQKAEVAAQRAREAVNTIILGQRKAKMITNLPAKLADANGSGYKELFLVEGDSAGGILKMIRNHETQAVLPLKGKVLNTYDRELADIIQNKEIKELLLTLGCGVGEMVNTKNLRYDKIIIATDGDPDGDHINLLLLSLFIQHLRPLILGNYIYRVITPLFGIKVGKEHKYFYNSSELDAYTKVHGIPEHIERFKGLGAHDPQEIEQFLINDKTRRLEPLKIEDLNETLRLFNAMMGSNLELRKLLIRTGGMGDE